MKRIVGRARVVRVAHAAAAAGGGVVVGVVAGAAPHA